jgi:hypothetical protein
MTSAPKTRDSNKPRRDETISPAGTHDKPELTDNSKNPGSGMLPRKQDDAVEGPSG